MKESPIFQHRRWQCLVIACCFLIIPPLAPVFARDSLTWMEVSMPPHFIHNGALQNQGYGDIVSKLLRQRLPEYDHYQMTTNVVRHFDKFKRGEKICAIGLYQTPERERFLHFSIPCLLTMPPALIIRKDRLKQWGLETVISLDQLLDNPDFRLGMSKDRSYGQRLDAILSRHVRRTNLVVFSGQEIGENYFKMLLLDRLDGLIGLPDEAMYRAEQMGIRDQLTTLIFEENQRNYEGWLCAVACPKNEWGKEIIEKINPILIELRPTERYRRAYERWLDSNSMPSYRKVYDEIFLTTKP